MQIHFEKKHEHNMYYRAVVNEIVDIFKKGTLSTNINETTDSCLIVGIFWNRIWCCPYIGHKMFPCIQNYNHIQKS